MKVKTGLMSIMLLVLILAMAGTVSAATVNLVEKDGEPNWNVVPGSNCGTLTYSIDASGMLTYSFVVDDSNTLIGDHVLVVIAPELSGDSGWPQTGSMALTGLSGSADISGLLGNIYDGKDYDGSVYGAKIWYVPTAIFDGSKFTDWDLGNILFEEDLITPTTAPIPEFSTIAIPVASILGLLFFFNYRKRRREH